jgi:hypothetical protein
VRKEPDLADENILRNMVTGDVSYLADENILRNMVTGDVTWICGYVVATKTQFFTLGLKNFAD